MWTWSGEAGFKPGLDSKPHGVAPPLHCFSYSSQFTLIFPKFNLLILKRKKRRHLGLGVCVWFRRYENESMNVITKRDIGQARKLIITFLWQLSSSTCQFSLNTSFISSFQLDSGGSAYCCKRESLTPFPSPWRWKKALWPEELPEAISIISCRDYRGLDCKLLKAGRPLEHLILYFKRNKRDGNLIITDTAQLSSGLEIWEGKHHSLLCRTATLYIIL